MHRYKITVEYDGSPFFGWQRQNGLQTIQQCLEESLLPILKDIVRINGAGRTDTGVHALAQVAHFDSPIEFECYRIQDCMNAHLQNIPISVLHVEKADENFDARFSAKERTYLYKIINRRPKVSLLINRCWHVKYELNAEQMHMAAQSLIGKHDFSSFRAAGCQSKSAIKNINNISVARKDELIEFHISAPSFLYHQVRNIVGTLAKVGSGQWSHDDFIRVLKSCDRTKAGQSAPACGLYIKSIKY